MGPAYPPRHCSALRNTWGHPHKYDAILHMAERIFWLCCRALPQREDDAGVINVPAASNSLNLLLRDEGLMRFVKYVGAAAPSSRWDVAMEYRPEDDDSEEEQQ